uniref:Uncharacterized protein n=1 Tax=Chlamydomonas leiostraca TaxID=1034604 RepID=A0A7S0RVW3_9CHLO
MTGPPDAPGAGDAPAVGGGIDGPGGGEEGATHKAAKVVERRSLRRLMPNTWAIIKALPRTLKLQEPQFKEVVVVYRTSGTGRTSGRKSKVPARARSTTERLRDILRRRNIHVKCFHDIPMADIEVIFPDKKVYLKTVSLINMVVQAVMAFVAAIAALWKTAALDLNAVWSALSLVGARCGQLYSSMQAERSQMIQDMVNILYDKTNDAQEGVVSMLLEDMAEQQLKEAVLAYTLLYMNIEDELSRDKLDELCEDFLEQHFALKVDFAVEDALPRLVEWGLVKENPKTGRFQAVNVEAAHKQLVKRWVVAYEALSKPPAMKTLPMTALLPGGERQMIEAWSGQNLAAPGGSFVAKAAPAGSGPATSAAVTQPVTAARGGKEVPAASSASTASAAELQSGPSFKSKPSIMGDRPSPAHTTPLESVPESPPSVTSKQVANSRGSPGVSTGSTAAAPKAKRGLTAFFRSRSKGSKAMDASSPTRTA